MLCECAISSIKERCTHIRSRFEMTRIRTSVKDDFGLTKFDFCKYNRAKQNSTD